MPAVSPPEPDPGWLLLVYRVPPEPTRLRAAVWRRLKSLGAIYLQNSAAALPAGAEAERAMRKLRDEILEMSGTAVLMSCSVMAGAPAGMSPLPGAREPGNEGSAHTNHNIPAPPGAGSTAQPLP